MTKNKSKSFVLKYNSWFKTSWHFKKRKKFGSSFHLIFHNNLYTEEEEKLNEFLVLLKWSEILLQFPPVEFWKSFTRPSILSFSFLEGKKVHENHKSNWSEKAEIEKNQTDHCSILLNKIVKVILPYFYFKISIERRYSTKRNAMDIFSHFLQQKSIPMVYSIV